MANGSKNARRGVLILAFNFLLLAGTQATSSADEVRREIPREEPRQAVRRGCVGSDDIASVELYPDAIVVDRNGVERIEYHVEISILQGDVVGLAWQAQIARPNGSIVQQLASGESTKTAGEVEVTAALPTPALGDGYYQVIVKAAVAASELPDDVARTVRYIDVRAGNWREVDDDEWHARSDADLESTGATEEGSK